MHTKHLFDKDENANLELNPNIFVDSSYSDNQFIAAFEYSTDADDEQSSNEETNPVKSRKKRKSRAGTYNIVQHGERLIKAKQRYSSWFLLYVDHPNIGDESFLKDFRRRFRLPHYKHKELLLDVKNNPLFLDGEIILTRVLGCRPDQWSFYY